jgi:hypothetical protein
VLPLLLGAYLIVCMIAVVWCRNSFVSNACSLCIADTALTSVARVFITLLVLLSYPLQCHPARRCVLTIIEQCRTALARHSNSVLSGSGDSFDAVKTSSGPALNSLYISVTRRAGDGSGAVTDSGDLSPIESNSLNRIVAHSNNPLRSPLHVSGEDALEWELSSSADSSGSTGDNGEAVAGGGRKREVELGLTLGLDISDSGHTGDPEAAKSLACGSADVQFAVVTVSCRPILVHLTQLTPSAWCVLSGVFPGTDAGHRHQRKGPERDAGPRGRYRLHHGVLYSSRVLLLPDVQRPSGRTGLEAQSGAGARHSRDSYHTFVLDFHLFVKR